MTSATGELPSASRSDFPLEIRCLGYLSRKVQAGAGDTLRLRPGSNELGELTVNSVKKGVLYLKGYVREYSSLTTEIDTVLLFREKAVDFMVATRRAKGFDSRLTPRLLASRSYYRFLTPAGEDSVGNYFRSNFSRTDWIGLPPGYQTLPQGLSPGGEVRSPSIVWRRDSSGIDLEADILGDTANRRLMPLITSFMNLDVNFTELKTFGRYAVEADDKPAELFADALTRLSVSMVFDGQGRRFPLVYGTDDKYTVKTLAEIFITDRRYISTGQARKLERNCPAMTADDIMAPPEAGSLPEEIMALKQRVENIDHTGRHLDFTADPDTYSGRISGPIEPWFKSMFKSIFNLK